MYDLHSHMSFVLGKAEHPANEYINESVYWQLNKSNLGFLLLEQFLYTYKNTHISRVLLQLAAVLHCLVWTIQAARFVFRVNAAVPK